MSPLPEPPSHHSYGRALIFPDTVLVDTSTAGKAPGTLAAADRDILGSAALHLE